MPGTMNGTGMELFFILQEIDQSQVQHKKRSYQPSVNFDCCICALDMLINNHSNKTSVLLAVICHILWIWQQVSFVWRAFPATTCDKGLFLENRFQHRFTVYRMTLSPGYSTKGKATFMGDLEHYPNLSVVRIAAHPRWQHFRGVALLHSWGVAHWCTPQARSISSLLSCICLPTSLGVAGAVYHLWHNSTHSGVFPAVLNLC